MFNTYCDITKLAGVNRLNANCVHIHFNQNSIVNSTVQSQAMGPSNH